MGVSTGLGGWRIIRTLGMKVTHLDTPQGFSAEAAAATTITISARLGATGAYILVSDLANDTFFARIALDVDGKSLEIDSRPSDAIALAVRAQVPIYAEESVLEKAGVRLDQEGQPLEKGETREIEPTSEAGAEELEKLSPFRDVIEGLDLEDFEAK